MRPRRQNPPARRYASGTSLIEVLVTVIIVVVGLLGMAGIQIRSQTLELESYQRGQALILLQDMLDRMNGNAANAASYIIADNAPLGTGAVDDANCASLGTRAAVDLCEWSKALKGSSEVSGGVARGTMIDGRGCVTEITAGTTYIVSVVWQGMSDLVAPAAGCGAGEYDSLASRRAVSAVVQVPNLGAL